MSTTYTIEFKGNYVHVQNPPDYEITAEGMERLWSDLAEACLKYDCRKVLSEGKSPVRRLKTLDAFSSGTAAAESIPGLLLAVVFEDYVTDQLTSFFKAVALNRGASVEFFSDREQALRWLGLDSSRQSA